MEIKLLAFAAVATLFASGTDAVFEHEAGLLDWRKQHVGRVVAADFAQQGKYLTMVTDANAVAALNIRTGDIAWRQVLPENSIPMNTMYSTGDAVISISGDGTRAHRWDARYGTLMWEAVLHSTPIVPPTSSQLARRSEPKVDSWFSNFDSILVSENDGEVLAVMAQGKVKVLDVGDGSVLWSASLSESATYHVLSSNAGKIFAIGVGDKEGGGKQLIAESWDTTSGDTAPEWKVPLEFDITGKSCRVSSQTLVCLDGTTLVGVGEAGVFKTVPLTGDANTLSFAATKESSSVIIVKSSSGSAIAFKIDGTTFTKIEESTTLSVTKFEDKEVVVGVKQSDTSPSTYKFSFVDVASGTALTMGEPVEAMSSAKDATVALCFGYLFRRTSDKTIGFAATLQTADDAMLSIRKGEVTWKRDEALADIADALFVDLPAAASSHVQQQEASLPVMAVNRVMGQIQDLFSSSTSDYQGDFVQDFFNQNKLIVVATHCGKVFGILSNKGTVVWSHFQAPSGGESYTSVKVLSLRSTNSDKPTALVVFKSSSGCHTININPLTGEVYDSKALASPVQLVVPTPAHDVDGAHVYLVLDAESKVTVIPATATAAAAVKAVDQPIFLHTIDEVTGLVQGYRISKTDLEAEPMWTISFDSAVESIAAVATRHPESRINSIGETLGDRNVIYKYLNPNMVAIATMSPYLRGSANLTVYLMDTVKGSIITKVEHSGVYGAVHLTQSANWVVYHFRNRKAKRNEVGILELFDGSDEAPIESFSSFQATPPIVLRQAYIAPFTVTALATTYTAKGVTETQVLAAMTSGSLAGIHKRLVDARRPTNAKATKHAEGLIPYHPLLMLQNEKNLNYNLTLSSVRNIYAAPCGLESTTAVLATGLDTYMTLTAPSKRFDTLSADFPHLLLVGSLVGLSSLVFFLRTKGTEKQLQTLWK